MVKVNLRQHEGCRYFAFQYGMNPDYPRDPIFRKTLPGQWNTLVRRIRSDSQPIRNNLNTSTTSFRQPCHWIHCNYLITIHMR